MKRREAFLRDCEDITSGLKGQEKWQGQKKKKKEAGVLKLRPARDGDEND